MDIQKLIGGEVIYEDEREFWGGADRYLSGDGKYRTGEDEVHW